MVVFCLELILSYFVVLFLLAAANNFSGLAVDPLYFSHAALNYCLVLFFCFSLDLQKFS